MLCTLHSETKNKQTNKNTFRRGFWSGPENKADFLSSQPSVKHWTWQWHSSHFGTDLLRHGKTIIGRRRWQACRHDGSQWIPFVHRAFIQHESHLIEPPQGSRSCYRGRQAGRSSWLPRSWCASGGTANAYWIISGNIHLLERGNGAHEAQMQFELLSHSVGRGKNCLYERKDVNVNLVNQKK